MRRLVCFLGVTGLLTAGYAQIWEKRLAPGLTYRMEVDLNLPRTLHALRWNPAGSVKAVPELAGGSIYENDATQGRKPLSSIVREAKAIAGVNGDFFPWTGDPLGLMVRDKVLLSLGFPNRSSFAWGKNAATAIPGNRLAMFIGSQSISIPNLNAELPDNAVGLFTSEAGLVKAKGNAGYTRLKVVSGEWHVGKTVRAEVLGPVSVPTLTPGEVLLVGTGTQAGIGLGLRGGQVVEFKLEVENLDWSRFDHAISGGPNLVRGGLVMTDAAAQGFADTFYDKRHPRTAIGVTARNDVYFVVVDGKHGFSAGATIDELARVMQRLGCVEAINLDGGGSSEMVLFDQVISRPSDGKEREIANAVVFYSPLPVESGPPPVLNAPASMQVGKSTILRLVNSQKATIPNRTVLWSATGPGWIDQGGLLRATGEGTLVISAWCQGHVVRKEINVTR